MENARQFQAVFDRFLRNMGANRLNRAQAAAALTQFSDAVRAIEAQYTPAKARASARGAAPTRVSTSRDHVADNSGAGYSADELARLEALVGERMYESGSAHDLFMRFDIKGRGAIPPWELQEGLEMVGLGLTADEAAYLVNKYSSTGSLSYSDFARMYSACGSQTSTYDSAFVGDHVVQAVTPKMAATFDYHTSSTERLEGIKATVRSKIYQVFGAPSRAFLALDYANNSVITIGDLVSGLRRHGVVLSREDAAGIIDPFARAHKNQLTLTEFNKFCSSGLIPHSRGAAMTDSIGQSSAAAAMPAAGVPSAAAPSASTGRALFRAAHGAGQGSGAGASGGVRAGWAGSDAPAAPATSYSQTQVQGIVARVSEALYRHGNVRKMLKQWRTSKAGVSASDMKHGLHRIGTNVTMDEALALVQAYGGRDGRISLHEFMDMLSSVA